MKKEVQPVQGAHEADKAIHKIRYEIWEYAVNAFCANHKNAIENPQTTSEMDKRNKSIIEMVIDRGCVPYTIQENYKDVHKEMIRRATEPKEVSKQNVDMSMITGQMIPQNA